MKIVIVTPYYAPAWSYGGPPKVLSLLARQLVKKGHMVSVITTDVLDVKRNDNIKETKDGVYIYRFRTISNYLAYKQKLFFVPHLLDKSKKIIESADVVLFSDVRSILNWQLFGYVFRKRIPYGVFAFGQIPYEYGWKSLVKKIFDIIWVRRFISLSTWCFCQTKHEKQMFLRYFQKRMSEIKLLLLPVDLSHKIAKNSYVDFSRYGILSKDKIILFVGRFHYLKGVDRLLKFCVPLLRKNHRLKLVLIGRDDGILGQVQSMVPKDLKESVIFPGPVYGDAVSAWYRRAGCFAFTPRYFEETSTAALEALSCGCPVLTVYESEIPFLSEYNAGMLVRCDQVHIRNGIVRVLKQKATMSKSALRLIKDHYSVEKVTEDMLAYVGKSVCI